MPPTVAAVLAAFAPLFSRLVWAHAQVLVVGALLTPAQRTAAAALRATERADAPQFHRYQRVLSHARWPSLAIGRSPDTARRRLRPGLPARSWNRRDARTTAVAEDRR